MAAFVNIAQSLQTSADNMNRPCMPTARIRLKDPDTFDRSNPEKLDAFMTTVHINFQASPDDFVTEVAKISYIMSFLHGSATDWFTPDILSHDPAHPPIWMTSSLALVFAFRSPRLSPSCGNQT